MGTQTYILYGYDGSKSCRSPFLSFFHFCDTPEYLKIIVLKVILSLPLNSMSVEHFGARGTQTEILSGHYSCNSGPNPFFGPFPIFWTPRSILKQ